jgi:hypothetical protein
MVGIFGGEGLEQRDRLVGVLGLDEGAPELDGSGRRGRVIGELLDQAPEVAHRRIPLLELEIGPAEPVESVGKER